MKINFLKIAKTAIKVLPLIRHAFKKDRSVGEIIGDIVGIGATAAVTYFSL